MKYYSFIFLLVCCISFVELISIPDWYSEHYHELTSGLGPSELNVPNFKYPDANSVLAVFGEKAFPVWLNSNGDAKIAAALYGKGRVIVGGHEDWFTLSMSSSMNHFVQNFVSWTSRGKSNPVIGCHEANLIGTKCVRFSIEEIETNQVDVYFMLANETDTMENADRIKKFVRDGGGLIFAHRAWEWGGYPPMTDYQTPYTEGYEGNMVTREMGIIMGERDYVCDFIKCPVIHGFDVPERPRNFRHALDIILDTEMKLAASDGTYSPNNSHRIAVNTLWRSGSYFLLPEILQNDIFKGFSEKAEKIYRLTNDSVVFSKTSTLAYRKILQKENVDPKKLKKAPDVDNFPYDVPSDAKRISSSFTLNATTGEYNDKFYISQPKKWVWKATGFYSAPAEIITVTLPESLKGKSRIQLGAHSDNLFPVMELKRAPEIVITFPVSSTAMKVASPYGGLIYITLDKNLNLGSVEIGIENAIAAPYFVLGETTEEEWKDSISKRKAPWAELEAPGNINLVVPTNLIKSIKNITELMTFWDDSMKIANKFAGFDNQQRSRAERIVFDIQLMYGHLHSGYPIGAHLPQALEHLNMTRLTYNGTWGAFHELGHNHQWKDWTIWNTIETHCNWWSIVMNEAIHQRLSHKQLPNRDKRISNWILKGKPWDEWKVWLALDTYTILAEKFGWFEGFAPVTKKYYTLNDEVVGDVSKLNVWARFFMEGVKTDLCEYFQWWKWELSEETKRVCESMDNKIKLNELLRDEHLQLEQQNPFSLFIKSLALNMECPFCY